MRQKIVAGNWKMNMNLEEGMRLSSEVVNMVADEVSGDVKAILVTPFVHLTGVAKIIAHNPAVFLGAQTCSEHDSGAYTGETSVEMLKSAGVDYVLVGHSERREYFKEGSEMLALKIDTALSAGITPIFCCGEPLEIRDSGSHFEFVSKQMAESLFHLSESEILKVHIAYEPIWAIGTGKTASSQQAQDMHAHLRKSVGEKYGVDVADAISILYGGSCKPGNAKEIFACPDVDGGLIGGASLKSRDFVDIIKSF